MLSTRHTNFWLFSIALLLIIIMLSAAWLAQQQRDAVLMADLDRVHQLQVQSMQQLQFQLQQDALIAADLVYANSTVRTLVAEAAARFQQQQDPAGFNDIRSQLMAELAPSWQALQPFAIRQLQFHLVPDVVSLLRVHQPQHHSDSLADIRPMVLEVQQQGQAMAGLEVGRFGLGVRAVLPIKASDDSVIASMETGFALNDLIWQRQQQLRQKGVHDAGISVLVSARLGEQFVYPLQDAHPDWLIDVETDNRMSYWLQQLLFPSRVASPQSLHVMHNEHHYALSLVPWHSYGQQMEASAAVVLVSWQDISSMIAAHQAQNRQIWGLWLGAIVISVLALFFLVKRLQKATAHSLQKQQQALRWSEQRLKALFSLSPLPILLNRMEDGAFIEANHAMEQLVGYNQQELAALSYWDLTPEIYADDEQKQLESLQSKGRYGPYRKQYRHKDGHLIDIELNGVRFENPAGESMIWTIVMDLTERNKLDKMKDEFIATVSHELRTPLTSIAGSLSLVLAGAAGELTEKSRKMLSIAERNSKRLTLLVNDLLDMEKLAAGKVAFFPEIIPLQTLLQDAMEQNKPFADKHQIQLLLANAPAAAIFADPARIQQVLTNLISNAVKFSPAGSQVCIQAELGKDKVRIGIQDEGPGLSQEEISSLFQRFSQLNNSTTKQQGGTGLGLAICREIIHQSGGSIGVDSVPGQGAFFWFELPLADMGSEQSSLEKVLVVEDDADIASMLAAMLQQEGFEADWAPDTATAWQLLAKQHYRLLTLDLRLQNEHGSDFFLRLRDNPATRDLPVLIISAYLQEGKVQLASMAQAIDWLEKPVQQEVLAAKLTQLLEQASWQQDARVLHVEDDEDITTIVQAHLEAHCRYYKAATLQKARMLLHQHQFDLLLLDIGLPDGLGWDLLQDIRALQGDIPVLVFSAQDLSVHQHGKVQATFAKSKVEPAELVKRIKAILSNE
ncbi:response regulator [Alkalimonas delamerensis]|uniref:histidine kinase n=1 Tax=Alkalimonas delamerensis TaxID=265981 RepID=A0ABT9GM43_9GAMM|nr:response regulator [Alkalimonas delamerensis]MDP4527890.1 response regulator [Alkalimonas delamerensis]